MEPLRLLARGQRGGASEYQPGARAGALPGAARRRAPRRCHAATKPRSRAHDNTNDRDPCRSRRHIWPRAPDWSPRSRRPRKAVGQPNEPRRARRTPRSHGVVERERASRSPSTTVLASPSRRRTTPLVLAALAAVGRRRRRACSAPAERVARFCTRRRRFREHADPRGRRGALATRRQLHRPRRADVHVLGGSVTALATENVACAPPA